MKFNTRGVVSILLTGIGLYMIITIDGVSVADKIFQSCGINAWTKGDTGFHTSNYLAIIFFSASIIVARKTDINVAVKVGVCAACFGIAVIICSSIVYLLSLD